MDERRRKTKARKKTVPPVAVEKKPVEIKGDTPEQALIADAGKKPMTHQEVVETKPYRGMWEQELDAAEKTEGAGRPWFNGRPIRSIVKKLEDIFKIGGSVKQACAYAEIAKQSYYEFVKDKPKLLDHFEHLSENITIVALNTVAKAIPSNPSIAMTILERKMAKDFGETKQLNVNVKSTSFSVNAQLMALKGEFDKRFLDEINKADIAGHIPQESDDFSIPAPAKLLERNEGKVVESNEQAGGAAIPPGS